MVAGERGIVGLAMSEDITTVGFVAAPQKGAASVPRFGRRLRKCQERRLHVGSEGENLGSAGSQQRFDVGRGAVAPPNPDNLRRRPPQEVRLVEVRVLRDNSGAVVLGVTPDRGVGRSGQSDISNVYGPRKHIR